MTPPIPRKKAFYANSCKCCSPLPQGSRWAICGWRRGIYRSGGNDDGHPDDSGGGDGADSRDRPVHEVVTVVVTRWEKALYAEQLSQNLSCRNSRYKGDGH